MAGLSVFACALALTSPAMGQESERAHTPLDALHKLPGPTRRVAHFGDWNRDGVPDLVMEHGSSSDHQIQIHCALDGIGLAVLWVGPSSVTFGEAPPWDLGDVDGDGVLDLILGLPSDSTTGVHAGAVQIVSGATMQTIAVTYAASAHDRYGSSVAYLADVNGDGLGDYAVGSPMSGDLTSSQLRQRAGFSGVPFENPSHQRMVDARGPAPGRVLARSGADQGVLWVAKGQRAGHGFGEAVARLSDLDGDCHDELLVRCSPDSLEPARILSGRTGTIVFQIAHQFAPCGSAGDFDGDGLDDVYLDSFQSQDDASTRGERATVVSGRTRKTLCKVDYPDWNGSFGMTAGVGDLDGDGFDELALGEPDFGRGEDQVALEDLAGMSLEEAIALGSHPVSVSTESGALRVVSGRTRKPIWGLWGRPGFWDSVGYSACAIPDVSGDGAPDLVVCGRSASWVFEGP